MMKIVLVILLLVLALALQTSAHTHESLDEEEVDCLFQKPDCLCLEYELPVCGTNGCTYSNPCRMRCADEKMLHEGLCLEDQETQ